MLFTITVSAFIATQGVNLGNLNDPTDYLAGTISDLNYLGVKNARAGWTTPGASGWYTIAQAASIAAITKLDLLANSDNVFNGPTTNDIANFASLQAAYPGSVKYVEGLNEINNQPVAYGGYGGYATGYVQASNGQYYDQTNSPNAGGVSELNAGIAYQQAVYNAVTTNSYLSGVDVIGFTGYQAGSPYISGLDGSGNPIFDAAIPNTTDMISGGYATLNNSHFYPTGAPSTISTATAFPFLTSTQLTNYQNSGQLTYTEAGYNSAYYTNTTQAQYTIDLFLDGALNKIALTYIFTNNDGDGTDLYGLFTAYDYSSCPNCPKPAAVAIHNMNTILSAGNTGFIPNPIPVPYTVSGETSSAFDLEMTSTNGNSAIALWNEGTTTLSETVSLGIHSNVVIYDPISSTTPIATFSNTNSFMVSVGLDALIIEVTPINCVTGG